MKKIVVISQHRENPTEVDLEADTETTKRIVTTYRLEITVVMN